MPDDMQQATRLTRAGRLTEATALLQRLLRGRARPDHHGPTIDAPVAPPIQPPIEPPAGHGGRFVAGSFTNEAGTRPYKLYVPANPSGGPMPLVVMLHGCTQSPDDFAAGTRMNVAAEAQGCLVLYPQQTEAANPSRCWNWFNAAEQHRGQGEPSLIAGMTRAVMAEHPVDPRRVYIAGMSAGGAAATTIGAAYPELYAAIGVHSGLPRGAAHDLASGFAAMRRPGPGAPPRPGMPPMIVFHGDRDTTVHPANADAIIAQAIPASPWRTQTAEGQAPGGYGYTRTLHTDPDGATRLEQWAIHGAGHAWSGGSPAGSFTDARGPDATAELLRFFLEHPGPGA